MPIRSTGASRVRVCKNAALVAFATSAAAPGLVSFRRSLSSCSLRTGSSRRIRSPDRNCRSALPFGSVAVPEPQGAASQTFDQPSEEHILWRKPLEIGYEYTRKKRSLIIPLRLEESV